MTEKYQVRRKPGGFIRVVNLESDRVEGYWNPHDKYWLDLTGLQEAR